MRTSGVSVPLAGKCYSYGMVPQWVTDLVIAADYAVIGASLCWVAFSRKSALAARILLIFGAFILFCGGGHAIDARYLVAGRCIAGTVWRQWWNLGTAIASTVALIFVVPRLKEYIDILKHPVLVSQLNGRIMEQEAEIASLTRKVDDVERRSGNL